MSVIGDTDGDAKMGYVIVGIWALICAFVYTFYFAIPEFNKDWEKYDRWRSEKEYDTLLIYFEFIIELFLKKHNINDINININSCLINKYENGSEFIKYHQDSTKAFGNSHYIILYSIGEERIMRFKNINNNNDIFDIKLKSNSLLIIYPEINYNYQHSILKDNTKNVRYSLTFREFIS